MKYILSYKLFENNESEIWYHGTDEDFTEFREPDEKTKPTSKLGIWFTNIEDFTEYFGAKIVKAKLNYKNPCYVTLEQWDDIRRDHAKDVVYFDDLRKRLIKKGYDSFYVRGQDDTFAGTKVNTPDVIAVFYKEQIEIID